MKTTLTILFAILLLAAVASAFADKNVLANSSFEVCTTEKTPDFWGQGSMGIISNYWQERIDEWRTRWGVDDTVSHSGKRSLRIDCPGKDSTDLVAYAKWVDLPALNVPWTLSVWLKANREDMPVGITFQPGSKVVKVGKEWARYWVTASPYDKTQTVIISPQDKGVIWVDDVQFEQADAPTDYAPSSYDATLTGQAVHRMVPASRPFRWTPGGAKPASVSIDEHRRLIVEGKPFIPFGSGFWKLPTRKLLKTLAEGGFTAIVIMVKDENKIEDVERCLNDANSYGLKVICSMLGGITNKYRAELLTRFRSHPALIAWNVVDEPDGDHQYVKDAYNQAKKLDPSRPAYINYAPSFYFPTVLPTDIASLDRYDIGAEPDGPIYQAEFTDQLEKIAIPAGKPSWIWLQSGGNAYWMSRCPTGPEEECMVYLTLIHGLRGIQFHVDMPQSVELWRTMTMLAVEVRQLTPILSSIEPAPTVTAEPSGRLAIHVLGETYKGRRYAIAANAGPSPVDAKITVSGGGKSANVLFENRRVKVENGVIKDTFLGYQRHVYEVR